MRTESLGCGNGLQKWQFYTGSCLRVFLIFSLSFDSSAAGGQFKNDNADSQHVEHAKHLSSGELLRYINKLSGQGNVKALTAIAQSRLQHSDVATSKLCELLDTDKAIAFCTTLDLRSKNWQCAMSSIQHHPKQKVVGYIKQVATSSIPEVRWRCYEICRVNNWDDLLQQAKQDVSSKVPLKVTSIFVGTLGEGARHYIDTLKNH